MLPQHAAAAMVQRFLVGSGGEFVEADAG